MIPRRHAAAVLAFATIATVYFTVDPPAVSDAERAALAARFRFARLDLPEPAGRPRYGRDVHPRFNHLKAWISAGGAAVALADFDGDGKSNDLCLIDSRFDTVMLMPVPGTRPRFGARELDPAPLRYDKKVMAPMGCVPGDYDEDGDIDVLVYYWGRAPVVFLNRGDGRVFVPTELVAGEERWNTNACTRADIDGDGHIDLVFGNYFPDGARMLDTTDAGADASLARMQDSMALGKNGGTNRVLLWQTPDKNQRIRFRDVSSALPEGEVTTWTLAVGAADLDNDLLPELYFANDFGPDCLLHNRSTPGKPAFAVLKGRRTLRSAKSAVLGNDSFKGMGVDFGDLNGDGLLDFYVSNITTEWGLQELQLCFVSTGDLASMKQGHAPYVNRSGPLGLARTGWGWETRLADFDNDGLLEVMEATGFVRGTTGRWPELHEVAMANDLLLQSPTFWHRFADGDDVSGSNHNPFFVRSSTGRFVDLAAELGLDEPYVSRGIAVADVDGDGDLDFALGNQWEQSYFFRNDAPAPGAFMGLRMRLPVQPLGKTMVFPGFDTGLASRPAIGAAVSVERPDGVILVGQVDGGNGHSGVRSPDLHFGLGKASGSARAMVGFSWRDSNGHKHKIRMPLAAGWHTVYLAGGSNNTNGEKR